MMAPSCSLALAPFGRCVKYASAPTAGKRPVSADVLRVVS